MAVPAAKGSTVHEATMTLQSSLPVKVIPPEISSPSSVTAEPGAVAWQFERKGVVILPKAVGEDDLMAVALDAGAEDIADQGDTWQLTSPPSELPALRDALEAADIALDSADVTMLATTSVPLDNEGDARKVLRLIDLLEDHDDVQNVYANFDIPDAIIELVEA